MEGNYYPLLKWILFAPLAGFAVNGLLGKKLLGEKGGGVLGALAIFISFVFAVLSFSDLLNLPAENRLFRDTLYSWISAGTFSVDAAFRFDPLSAVMALIVTGVSFLIHVYSIGYMKGDNIHCCNPKQRSHLQSPSPRSWKIVLLFQLFLLKFQFLLR